ncbi:MAG: hypothetical protein HKN34_03020 [Gammaproteobacteria bacterium]|nr:hypothetical protein [Gammaproteobacteria bacterium]
MSTTTISIHNISAIKVTETNIVDKPEVKYSHKRIEITDVNGYTTEINLFSDKETPINLDLVNEE